MEKVFWNKKQLKEHLISLGIKKGMVFMPHFSYKAISPIDGGPNTVIDVILEVLGPDGTLVMPTFTFSFCEKRKWDVDKSPSEMGIITELFRKRPNVKRSIHPIYSVASIGKLSDIFSSCNDKNGVGLNSPFYYLKKYNAQLGIIGTGYNQGFTLIHHIEWLKNVDYRYLKGFKGKVITSSKIKEDEYSILVRDIKQNVVTDIRKFGFLLEINNIMKVGRFGWSIARICNANEFSDFAHKCIDEKIDNLLHRKDPDWVNKNKESEQFTLK